MTANELLSDGAMGVESAAEFSSLGRTYLYGAMERGELRFVKCGKRRLIPKRELIRFMGERLIGGWAITQETTT
jgi:excisionase family DNA binding protein